MLDVELGAEFEGGYFAGYYSLTENSTPTHALIISPKNEGEIYTTDAKFKAINTSDIDGASNTLWGYNNVVDSVLKPWCHNLNINGKQDWFIPAIFQLEIAYYNLKPTDGYNVKQDGYNKYSVPARTLQYQTNQPRQTRSPLFKEHGPQAFMTNNYWSSTVKDAFNTLTLNFTNGYQSTSLKNVEQYARAFRVVKL